jgi:hypothetical protein
MIIRVPRVYRFFRAGQSGYIIMEHIEGEVLDSLGDPTIGIERMALALSYFSKISSEKPGPLGGGMTDGLLWLYGDWISPTSLRDIEQYYNTRHFRKLPQSLDIGGYPLVLCHLDIAPRNIIQLNDGSICLLDWASAGFYPRLFEVCTLRLNSRRDGDWNNRLLHFVEDLSDEEQTQANLLDYGYSLSQKYHMYVLVYTLMQIGPND